VRLSKEEMQARDCLERSGFILARIERCPAFTQSFSVIPLEAERQTKR
jgi:hypothetical protein